MEKFSTPVFLSPGGRFCKILSVLFISLILALGAKPAFAIEEEKGPTIHPVFKYTAGIIASAILHEGAHALVAGVTGTRLDWKTGTYNQPLGFADYANSDAKGLAVYSSGLIAQTISSETILQIEKIDKNDHFVRGIMTWNVLNTMFYALDYWFLHISNKKNGDYYRGDIGGIEHYSNKTTANVFALSMTAIAAFQGYRFLKTQTWAPDWLKSNSNHVNLAPIHSGGLLLSFRLTF